MTEEMDTVEVISVKFKNRGKAYFFDPRQLTFQAGDSVVVDTAKGLEFGGVVRGNHAVRADAVVQPLRPVVRAATEEDIKRAELCRRREREAYVIARQKIEAHGLDMKLVDVDCQFEGNKIMFFFSSEGRVDFRELVKDLAGVFRTRIELRQIGVRDEARMLGGLGLCGRPFCCGLFMDQFAPVSTKMAKTQALSLNPAKISGCCGRLMCCLRHEQPAYEELVKGVPKNGAFVETPDGYGNVTQINVLRQTVKVKLDGPGEDSFRSYHVQDVAAIPGGRPRDGSPPPHILVLRPREPEPAPESEEEQAPMPEVIQRPGPERGAPGRPRTRREGAEDRAPGGKARPPRSRQRRPSGGPRPERADERQTTQRSPAPGGGGQGNHHRRSRPAGDTPQQGGLSGDAPPKKHRPNRPRRRPDADGEHKGGDTT